MAVGVRPSDAMPGLQALPMVVAQRGHAVHSCQSGPVTYVASLDGM